MAPTGQIRMQRAHTVHFSLSNARRRVLMSTVSAEDGHRAVHMPHCIHFVLIMPDPLRHGRNQYALLPQVADPLVAGIS